MTTPNEILTHALALPAIERATIAHSLLRSLPEPRLYRTEEELAGEVDARMKEIESGRTEMFDAHETIRRAAGGGGSGSPIMIVRTASAADQDVVAAAVWLETQQPNLGNQFLDEMEVVFVTLPEMPRANPMLHFPGVTFKHELRWTKAGRFSYLVIFHVASDEIHVVAVLHAHSDLERILRLHVGIK